MIKEGLYGEIRRPPEGSIEAAITDLEQLLEWMDPQRTYRFDAKQLALKMAISALKTPEAAAKAHNRQAATHRHRLTISLLKRPGLRRFSRPHF